LESVEENKIFPIARCALRQSLDTKTPINRRHWTETASAPGESGSTLDEPGSTLDEPGAVPLGKAIALE
jgi:hypothetical protein